MNQEDHDALPILPHGIREYQILCALAVTVLFLIDLQHGIVSLSALLLLVGVLGIPSCLRIAPILLLIAFAGTRLLKQFGSERLGIPGLGPRTGTQVEDLAASMALLAYVAAHYRLQSLVLNILPADPRRRSGPRRWLLGRAPILYTRRSGTLVSPQEVGWFLLMLPPWAALGQLLWALLVSRRNLQRDLEIENLLGLRVWSVQLLIVGWCIGAGVLISSAVLKAWRQRQARPEVAALFLQDALWRETRRDQARISRWLVWRRRRSKGDVP